MATVTAGFRCAPLNCPTAYDAGHDAEAPPEGDDDPARVLGLGMVQQHGRDDAVAQQDQERGPDRLCTDDAQADSSPRTSKNGDPGATLEPTLFGPERASQRRQSRVRAGAARLLPLFGGTDERRPTKWSTGSAEPWRGRARLAGADGVIGRSSADAAARARGGSGAPGRRCRPGRRTSLHAGHRLVAVLTRAARGSAGRTARRSAGGGMRARRAGGAATSARAAWRRAVPGDEDRQDRHVVGGGEDARRRSAACRASRRASGCPRGTAGGSSACSCRRCRWSAEPLSIPPPRREIGTVLNSSETVAATQRLR